MNRCNLMLATALAGVAGCSEKPEEPPPEPLLSDVPRWTVTAENADSCFGASVAVADFDGDGARDLAVSDGPCFFGQDLVPGRVALFRGEAGGSFSTAPVWTDLDWLNAPLGGRQMTLAAGDVDGDGRADLMVRSHSGVQLFTGITSVAQPLPAPAYRLGETGTWGPAILVDLGGDGRAELISIKGSNAQVWSATPGSAQLAGVRTIAGPFSVARLGDTDGDGFEDVVFVTSTGSLVYRGCPSTDSTCTAGLGFSPAWNTASRIWGAVPDLDGDGRAELLLTDGVFETPGRLAIHASDPATGTWSATPIGRTITDPNFPILGSPLAQPGDLDGDGRAGEFIVGSAGRLYAFFPAGGRPPLEPSFAWPRADLTQDQVLGGGAVFSTGPLSIDTPGDLDGDGRADLVVGNAPEYGDTRPGRVHVFAGGRLDSAPPPYLLGDQVCTAPSGTLPDLTVDQAALARSLFVEQRTFAADACEVVEGCIAEAGTRKLLRFTTAIQNVGGAAVIIPGPETAPHLYHFDACHGHDHLSDFARYELRSAGGATLATGRKQGFFLVDLAPSCSNGAVSTDFFPDQGISPGWSDVYLASIPCQWLDVTGVSDGEYTLRIGVDSLHIVDQDDVAPDTVSIRIRLEGDAVRVID